MAQSVKFYPYDITYKVVGGRPHIYLYGREADDGRRICVVDESFEPYFYAIMKEGVSAAELQEKLLKIRLEENGEIFQITRVSQVQKLLAKKSLSLFKITVNIPGAVPKISEVIRNWEMIWDLQENDILFARRYLIDRGIVPLTLCVAEGEFIESKSRIRMMRASAIVNNPIEALTNPRMLSFDIETYTPSNKTIDAGKNPILMLALYGKDFKKVWTWKKFGTDLEYVEFVQSEAELIEKFREAVVEYRPDFITGYYSDGFDLPYIKARAEKYKVKLDLGPDYGEPKMRGANDNECQITGIVHIDIYKFIKKVMRGSIDSGEFNLNAVSKHLLGKEKKGVDLDELSLIWDQRQQELGKYCEYNLHDAYLAYELTQKMLPTLIALVKIVGLPPFDVNRMGFSQLVEWYLLRQSPKFNEVAPNKPNEQEVSRRKMQSLEGGFVFEPKPGLYRDIAVFDYLSLYPTIISSHNIGPGSLMCECCKGAAKKIPGEEYWFCEKKKGFIPSLVENIISKRLEIKEIMKNANEEEKVFLNAQQGALKLMANSFYGYLGFAPARWYSLESAKSTTALGRFYIHKVIESAQKEGFVVLYSDTDSVFLSLEGKKREDALKFVGQINEQLPGLMELELEGFYPSGIFVSAKIGAYGAKKKYALLSEKGNLKIRGFETIRRNWSEVAKEVQEDVLNIILKENDPKKAMAHVKEVIKDLREKKVPAQKVIMRMQMVKDLVDYTAKGPHVAAAHRLRNKGVVVGSGTIIEYIVTSGSDIIRNRVKLPEEVSGNEYDPEYYIHHQVVPAVERIFDVLGFSKEMLTESHQQKTLAGFF